MKYTSREYDKYVLDGQIWRTDLTSEKFNYSIGTKLKFYYEFSKHKWISLRHFSYTFYRNSIIDFDRFINIVFVYTVQHVKQSIMRKIVNWCRGHKKKVEDVCVLFLLRTICDLLNSNSEEIWLSWPTYTHSTFALETNLLFFFKSEKKTHKCALAIIERRTRRQRKINPFVFAL